MKPHIKRKNGELWIFSSKKASKDSMPQYKCATWSVVFARVKRMNEG